MLRKFLSVVTIISLLFLCGCQLQEMGIVQPSIDELPEPTTTTIENPPLDDNSKAVEIPLNSVIGMSEEDAANLCLSVLGEKAEETGFKLAYRCIGAAEFEGQIYYVMYRTWLVDDNHWSYIGYAMVSVNGDVIYDGVIDQDGNYHFTRKLWEKQTI